eukprot:3423722-Prymnesium_polylepis.2
MRQPRQSSRWLTAWRTTSNLIGRPGCVYALQGPTAFPKRPFVLAPAHASSPALLGRSPLGTEHVIVCMRRRGVYAQNGSNWQRKYATAAKRAEICATRAGRLC